MIDIFVLFWVLVVLALSFSPFSKMVLVGKIYVAFMMSRYAPISLYSLGILAGRDDGFCQSLFQDVIKRLCGFCTSAYLQGKFHLLPYVYQNIPDSLRCRWLNLGGWSIIMSLRASLATWDLGLGGRGFINSYGTGLESWHLGG